MGNFILRPLLISDRDWVTQRIIHSWGSKLVVVHETIYQPAELPGFVVLAEGNIEGLLTYHFEGVSCEIITINSWNRGRGVGTTLIESVKQNARKNGCKRLWLTTTNDNTNALRFYQKRGFVISVIRINAVAGSRKIKPEIPLTGDDGIPIRDEIDLEMWF